MEAVLEYLDSIGVRGADASKVRHGFWVSSTAWRFSGQKQSALGQGAWSGGNWRKHGRATFAACGAWKLGLMLGFEVMFEGCRKPSNEHPIGCSFITSTPTAGSCISCEWGACAGTQVVKKFPEVTACSIEERLKENMAKLERDWKIKGPTAANVIKRQPQVRHTGQTALGGGGGGALFIFAMLDALRIQFRALAHCLSHPCALSLALLVQQRCWHGQYAKYM